MATEASGMSTTSFISAPWTLALFTRAFTASASSETNCSRDCKSRSEEDAVSLFRRRAFWDHLLLSHFLVGAQCRWQSQSQAGFIGWGCVDIHRWCRRVVHCPLHAGKTNTWMDSSPGRLNSLHKLFWIRQDTGLWGDNILKSCSNSKVHLQRMLGMSESLRVAVLHYSFSRKCKWNLQKFVASWCEF